MILAALRLLAGAVLAAPAAALAETIPVPAQPGALARALAAAAPGDELRLAAGVHQGGVVLDKPLSLTGEAGAVLDGGGSGSVIRVEAPGVDVRGLTIRRSGTDLQAMDSGVFVTVNGDGALVADNRIEDNLFGVYLHGPEGAVVRGNTVLGSRNPRMSERGNGVSVWNSPGSVVEGNDFRYGRDGILTTTSRDNVFRGNRFRDLRYGVHYMYTNNSTVSGNVSVGNHAGYALMYSTGVEARGNLSRGDRDHGFLLNFANGSEIAGNAVIEGGEKCVFIYNSNNNSFRRNHFQGCAIGVHFTAGSERNRIFENAFVGNRTQVKYVGTTNLDWSVDGTGNYWSDNVAFDLDGDGIADAAYRPNDLADQVVWRYPLAKLLLSSPAVQAVRWAQEQFPAITPGGVVDTAPLMRPPPVAALQGREAR